MRCPLFSPKKRQGQRSVAIVSVLILVVLITAVVLGFLITSGLEQTSSRSYKASSSNRLMADTAINLVQGEINEATSQGMNFAWASQPGAIRVYDNTGALSKIYKLYSAQNLTVTSASAMDTASTAAGANDMPPLTWSSDPALWVDLNASASDSQGNTHYPILNPTQASGVDGFSIGTTQGIASTTSVPMPVQWLYVLQNGQIIAPDTGGNGTALTFGNASVQPSAANPIVGRIAYWADDETCKVNVNTAGGDGVLSGTDPTPIANATFWDTPRYVAGDEVTNAWYQPQAGEYQRYPGHPGTVALNNILNGLGWNLGAAPSSSFYTVTPRYALGGSAAATIPIGTTNTIPVNASPANRLYPSIAEMLFTNNGTTDRAQSFLNQNNVATRQKIETARFFLTAHSQAPEVTLFGQPRISIWPEWSTTTTANSAGNLPGSRTPIDKVLAFTATVPGTTPSSYYFTRSDNTSDSVDINLVESNGQSRNQMLLNYLDYFTSQSVPGYGSSFWTKYTKTGTRQILTEIFDYIRTINEADTSQLSGATVANNPWEYCNTNGWSGYKNEGGQYEIAPTVINGTTLTGTILSSWTAPGYQGFAAYPRLTDIAIQFIGMSRGMVPPNSTFGTNYSLCTNFPSTSALPIPMYAGYSFSGNTFLFGTGDSGTDPNNTNNASSTVNTCTQWTNGNWASPIYPPNSTNIWYATTSTTTGPPGHQTTTTTPPPITYYVAPGNVIAGSTSTTAVQAFIHMGFIQPSQMLISDGASGAGSVHPYLEAEISGLNAFTIASGITGTPYGMGFTKDDIQVLNSDQGGGYFSGSWDDINFSNDFASKALGNGLMTSGGTGQFVNCFFSKIIPLSINPATGTGTMIFTGAPITVKLYDGAGNSPTANPSSTAARLVQTYTINFGKSAGSYVTTLPIPTVLPSGAYKNLSPYAALVAGPAGALTNLFPNVGPEVAISNPKSPDPWDRFWFPPSSVESGGDYNSGVIQPGDVVQGMILSPQWSDMRMLAISSVPAAAFTTHPNWGNSTLPLQAWAYGLTGGEEPYYSQIGTTNTSIPTFAGSTGNPSLSYVPGVLNPYATNYVNVSGSPFSQYAPHVAANVTPTYILANFGTHGQLMDWDTGIANLLDGPWVNKVDEGQWETIVGHTLPYYTFGSGTAATGAAFFSPNREVSSPGVFGSLSTGVDPTGANPQSWRTLLFRPNPGHFGATSPADHLMLDLFWMPQAEPYAISEPFSSAGKINLNYQIQPFTYITRNTALRAILNTQKIADMPSSAGLTYKGLINNNTQPNAIAGASSYTKNARYPLNIAATLQQFDDKFNGANISGANSSTTPDIFRSASQICEMYLVPNANVNGGTYSTSGGAGTFATDWYDGKTYGLVGDNVREKPYSNIYGLVTTKSNTFTTYYTVQSLKNASVNQATWNESTGTVLGEYRGSTTLERYIDPNQSLPDFAASPGSNTLDGNAPAGVLSYYKWRVVENHQFAP